MASSDAPLPAPVRSGLFTGYFNKRGGGTRPVFGRTSVKSRFFIIDPLMKIIAYYENEKAFETHPQSPLKPAIPLTLYEVSAIGIFPPHTAPELHLTLKNPKDAVSGRQSLELSVAPEPVHPPATLQALREALLAAGAGDASATTRPPAAQAPAPASEAPGPLL